MKQRGIHKLRDERGATAVEYALLVALIAIVLVVGVRAFGSSLSTYYDGQQRQVSTWAPN